MNEFAIVCHDRNLMETLCQMQMQGYKFNGKTECELRTQALAALLDSMLRACPAPESRELAVAA